MKNIIEKIIEWFKGAIAWLKRNWGKILESFKVIALFIVAGVGIIASAGSLNFATTAHEGIYAFAGGCNFGIVAFAVYTLYKILFKK